MIVCARAGGVRRDGTTGRHPCSRRSRLGAINRGSADGRHGLRRPLPARSGRTGPSASPDSTNSSASSAAFGSLRRFLTRSNSTSRTAAARRSSCASRTGRAAARFACRRATSRWYSRRSRPGQAEFLRAAVDYDGIGENEEDCFNLVIQRVRTPGSEHIEDQEIYRRVSIAPDAPRSIAAVLAESELARIAGELPLQRPDPTPRHDPRGHRRLCLLGHGRGRRRPADRLRHHRLGCAGNRTLRARRRRRIQPALHPAARAQCGPRREHAARRESLLPRTPRDPVRRSAASAGTARRRRSPRCATGRCRPISLHVLSAPSRLRQAARALRGLRALRRDCGHAVARVGALAGVDERLRR